MRYTASVLGIVMALAASIAFADALSVAEVGSFHVGGRPVSLTGLPTKDVVFTAGSAPVKVDPNGDFEVEHALRKEGGVADWWDLPKLGVNGNTHMLMMDTNSDQIARMIQKWMTEKGLML